MSTFWEKKQVSITGGEGFLGGHLLKQLKRKNPKKISIVKHSDYDLVNNDDVKRMYDDQKPDIVFHLAATVGGIGINKRNPGKFFYENAMMNLHVIHNAHLSKIDKIICVGTVSVYPKNTPIPFKEENIWDGYPQDEPMRRSPNISEAQIQLGFKSRIKFNIGLLKFLAWSKDVYSAD